MKNIRLFTALYVAFFMLFFTTAVFAQSRYDLSGTFEGVRKQFNVQHTEFSQEFQYKYDLQQKGDIVTGTSTIINEMGDYAVSQLKGVVVGNVFYFEEYAINDEMKNPYSVWCFKKGALDIVAKDGKLSLEGNTESFTSNYGKACTGGFTQISKTDSRYITEENNSKKNMEIQEALQVSLSPNPTPDMAEIQFTNTEKQSVSVEVYDLNGKKVQQVLNRTLEQGTQHIPFSLGNYSNGLYIVKLTTGKTVYSTSLVKAAN